MIDLLRSLMSCPLTCSYSSSRVERGKEKHEPICAGPHLQSRSCSMTARLENTVRHVWSVHDRVSAFLTSNKLSGQPRDV